mgnify:CR=1 FL=1
MNIKLSVIVPVYNVEPYIRRCLDSILHQTYQNLEIILVDDGSTDKSGAICDEYCCADPRIQVIHKKNGGIASARKAGVVHATGEYTTNVDPDDFLHSNDKNILNPHIRCYCLKYREKLLHHPHSFLILYSA